MFAQLEAGMKNDFEVLTSEELVEIVGGTTPDLNRSLYRKLGMCPCGGRH